MTNAKLIPSKLAPFNKLKFFRASAVLILTTLMLVVAAATTVATAQTYTDLYNFDGTHGARPIYPNILAQGRDGNLYSTTLGGGTNADGVVFKITPNGTLKVLYNFDNGSPQSGVTLGTDGNFYGSIASSEPEGSLFKITKAGVLTILYSFTGGADGAVPVAPPIQGNDGNFYGTTNTTVYKITPLGTFTLLASLPGASYAPLLQAADGNFYGTTYYGGRSDNGTIFKVTPNGILTTLHSFDFSNGNPSAPLIQGGDGNFYGTTEAYASGSGGIVFKLTPQGAFAVLHHFAGRDPNDGFEPDAGLVQANDGNLYGVTRYAASPWLYGVIFKITQAGEYSLLYYFDFTHGGNPQSTPIQHTNGKFYGLAADGGTDNDGVVYSFDLGLAPFVSLVSTSGKVGKTIEILGQGFTGTTAVSFDGTPATYAISSDTFLEATVPEGVNSGFVTVTTPSGTLTSNQPFRVRP